MKKILFMFLFCLFFSIIYLGKPTIIVSSVDSNYLDEINMARFDNKLMNYINDSELVYIIFEPSISENLKYLIAKDIESANYYSYAQQYLKTYNADYVLFYSIDRTWELDYFITFNLVDLNLSKVVLLKSYNVHLQSHIERTFLEFIGELIEYDKKFGLINYSEKERKEQRKWGNTFTHIIAFSLGAIISGGLVFLFSNSGNN